MRTFVRPWNFTLPIAVNANAIANRCGKLSHCAKARLKFPFRRRCRNQFERRCGSFFSDTTFQTRFDEGE